MSDFGWMGVDWEQRIDYDRMRRERPAKALAALQETDLDALFIFRVEDSRYLTGHRSHLGPVAALGFGTVVLHRRGDLVLYTMDKDTCRDSMPWLREDQIQGRANLRDHAGTVVAAMNIGTHASRVSLAEMEKTFLRELESAANELGTLLMG